MFQFGTFTTINVCSNLYLVTFKYWDLYYNKRRPPTVVPGPRRLSRETLNRVICVIMGDCYEAFVVMCSNVSIRDLYYNKRL